MQVRQGAGRFITAIFCFAVFAAACTGGDESGATGNNQGPSGPSGTSSGPSGTLTIAENETPASIDPIQALDSTVDELVLLSYDALVQYQPGSSEVTPALATDWSISDDGTEYTFTLRDDVTFHDGSPFTAEDVKYTLDRIKSLETGVASEIQPYESSKTSGDSEITVTLSSSYAPFLAALSRVYILNSKLVQENEGDDLGQAWLSTNEAGSGPYTISEYQPDQQVLFDAYLDYWGGWEGNHVAEVVMRYISEAGTQRAALQNGEIDIAMDIAKDDLAAFSEQPAYRVDVADTPIELYMFFNTQADGPAGDPAFRAAIEHAYDYDSHISGILLGYGTRPIGVLPAAMPCQAGLPQPAFDLNQAKQLLSDAGYTGTIDLTVGYLPELDEEKGAVQLLQSNLRDIGINLKAIGYTFPAHVESMKSIDTTADINLIYTFPPYADPNAVLFQNFYSKFTLARGYNFAQYANKEVDDLLLQAQKETDMDARCAIYDQIQSIVADDHVGLNVSLPQYVTVLSASVEGYKYNSWHHQTVNAYDIGLTS